mgnify:CR=1 FL=1
MGENVLKFGTYVRVGNAAEAYELLQKNRNNKIVGGGIWMRLGSRRVATAIDLSACGLDQIEETETEFRIGAMCTLRQLERHAELNALVNNVFEFAVHDIVGVQLRNTATVGGSIYGRFGFSDVLSAFLALDSYVELTGAGRVPLAEFVDMGYVRDVIEHIVVVKHDYRASYEAVRKAATDFPSLNVTAAWWNNSWHVTVGARPLRATLLQGEACGLTAEQPSEDELRALAASVRALSYGTNLWGSATTAVASRPRWRFMLCVALPASSFRPRLPASSRPCKCQSLPRTSIPAAACPASILTRCANGCQTHRSFLYAQRPQGQGSNCS